MARIAWRGGLRLRVGPQGQRASIVVTRVEPGDSLDAAVRAAVSAQVGGNPDGLRLTVGPLGKPELVQTAVGPRAGFSVSHCRGRSLIAVSLAGPVGVDLERVRPIGDLDRIADLYFSPPEAHAIAAAHGPRKLTAFYECWTSKEAYTKAIGTGLQTPLESFALATGEHAAAGVTWTSIHRRKWTLLRFQPWPGYSAAVAVSGHLPHAAFHTGTGRVGDHP